MEKKELEWIAQLCNLSFTEEELARFGGEFDKILKFISELKNTKVSCDVTHECVKSISDLRDDTVRPGLSIEDALMNAPKTRGRYFVVPQVVE